MSLPEVPAENIFIYSTFVILKKTEFHDHPASGVVADEYKIIDDQFTDNFKGLKNAHVHKHITVSDTANLGSYHVVVIVVDEDGNSSDTETLETHIEIIQ